MFEDDLMTHERERNSLICSGYIFIYEEIISGIKQCDRWSDMSPSRPLSNFLVYWELDKPFEPGEKKVIKKCRRRPVQPGGYAPPGGSGESRSLTIAQSTNFLKPSTPSGYEQQLSLFLLIMSELCWGKLLAYRLFRRRG